MRKKIVIFVVAYVINARWIDAQKQDIPEESKGKMDGFDFGLNI